MRLLRQRVTGSSHPHHPRVPASSPLLSSSLLNGLSRSPLDAALSCWIFPDMHSLPRHRIFFQNKSTLEKRNYLGPGRGFHFSFPFLYAFSKTCTLQSPKFIVYTEPQNIIQIETELISRHNLMKWCTCSLFLFEPCVLGTQLLFMLRLFFLNFHLDLHWNDLGCCQSVQRTGYLHSGKSSRELSLYALILKGLKLQYFLILFVLNSVVFLPTVSSNSKIITKQYLIFFTRMKD